MADTQTAPKSGRPTPRSLERDGPSARVGRSAKNLWLSSSARTRLVTFIAVMTFWQVTVMLWGRDYMATPIGVVRAAPGVLWGDALWGTASVTFARDAGLWVNAWWSLRAVIIGLLIGGLAGVLVGIIVGRIRVLEALVGPYINGMYATPMIALLPVFTLWFGFTPTTRMALIIFAAFPPLAIAAWDGSRSVPKRYLEVAQTFMAKRRHVWFGIAIPSSLPYMIAGFRLASGRALTAGVIAEFLTAVDGLGNFVMNLVRRFLHDEAVIGVAILTIAGIIMTVGMQKAIDRYMPWYRNI